MNFLDVFSSKKQLWEVNDSINQLQALELSQ